MPANSIARNIRAARSEGCTTPGVLQARGMSDKNAGRDVPWLLSRFNLGLKVSRETYAFSIPNGDAPVDLPWIRPSSWVAYLMQRWPVLLCGVETDVETTLESFWHCFRKVHPNHCIFEHADPERLRHTIPLALHGDEGRYLKKSNYMICTVESLLGSHGEAATKCSCCRDPVMQRYPGLARVAQGQHEARAKKQITAGKGHSYLSRFMCFGMASKQYKECPGLLSKGFELVSSDLRELCENGVVVEGKGTFYAGFLGVKGDMKFHHQVGHLSQSYFNLGRKHDYAICHLCQAGTSGVGFESLEDDPAWASAVDNVAPWKDGQSPALVSVPFDSVRKSAVFRLDPFHLWKVGLGRDLCGSGVVILCYLGKFDFEQDCAQNIDSRLARAHSCFRLWCLGARKTPALRSFTKLNLMVPDSLAFGWGNWKGSDNTLITQWLLFFLTNQMKPS